MARGLRGVLLCVVSVALAVTPVASLGATVRVAPSVVLLSGEVRDGNWYAVGDRVTVEGTINGDLIAIGNEVVVRGTVTGDVVALAWNLRLEGDIGGDVRALASSVQVEGIIAGDMAALAPWEVHINRTARIGGNLIVGEGGVVQVAGTVSGPTWLWVRHLQVAGGSMGSTTVARGMVEVKKGGGIASLAAPADAVVFVEAGGRVLRREALPRTAPPLWREWVVRAAVATLNVVFLTALVWGGVAARMTSRVVTEVVQRMWIASLRGFALIIGGAVAAGALLASGVAAGVGLLMLGLWIVLLLLGMAVVPLVLGEALRKTWAPRVPEGDIRVVVVGMGLSVLLALVPLVGWIVVGVLWVAAVGGWGRVLWQLIH